MRKIMLSVENLNITYDSKFALLKENPCKNMIVKDVSFEINSGEAFGLIGESGCGKTTIAKAICGLVQYTGNVKYNGNELSPMYKKKNAHEIQMIFQNPYSSLNPAMSIKKILEEPLIIHGYHSAIERLKKVKAMLHIVDIDENCLHRFVREISGGQRQRVAIACALMLNPKLIIADEILSALDVSVQANILNTLSAFKKEMDVTFLFISHDINVVSYFCDKIAVMYAGKIVETGNTNDIVRNPLHPYTKELIKSVLKIDSLTIYDKQSYRDIAVDFKGCSYAKCCSQFENACAEENLPLYFVGNQQVRCIKYAGVVKNDC